MGGEDGWVVVGKREKPGHCPYCRRKTLVRVDIPNWEKAEQCTHCGKTVTSGWISDKAGVLR